MGGNRHPKVSLQHLWLFDTLKSSAATWAWPFGNGDLKQFYSMSLCFCDQTEMTSIFFIVVPLLPAICCLFFQMNYCTINRKGNIKRAGGFYRKSIQVCSKGKCLSKNQAPLLKVEWSLQAWLSVTDHFISYLLSSLFPCLQALPQPERTDLKSLLYFNTVGLSSIPHWRTHFPLVLVRVGQVMLS